MSRIFVPSRGTKDWKRVFKNPGHEWGRGRAGRALAHCWERADGLPLEVQALFTTSGMPSFRCIEPLIVFLDYEIAMSAGGSKHDIFCLAKDSSGQLVSLTVLGKVLASFGPRIEKWRKTGEAGTVAQLEALARELELPASLPGELSYRLVHQAALAVATARRFNALSAVLIVHAFGQKHSWVGDYQAFLHFFHARRAASGLHFLRHAHGVSLYCGWAEGDAKYLRK